MCEWRSNGELILQRQTKHYYKELAMKNKISDLFKLCVLVSLFVLALLSMPEQPPVSEYPLIGKHQLKGDIAIVGDNIKAGLGNGNF